MSKVNTGLHNEQADSGEWAAVSRSRAAVYAWFSALFATELTDDAVAAYRQGRAEGLLAAFEGIGLEPEAARLRAAMQGWAALPHLRVELAADFARLFLLDARDAAAPYASAYLDPRRQLYGEPHQKMREFLSESGLRVHSGFKEPADHLSVLLAFVEAAIRQDAGADGEDCRRAAESQARFLNEALLSWLPQFAARCEALRGNAASDFYPAAAALLQAFVSEDAACLAQTDSSA